MEVDPVTPARSDDYQRLFEEAPEPYLLTDGDGRIELANRRAAELLGVTAQQLRGSSMADHLADDEEQALHDTLDRVRQGGRVSSWEVRLQDAAAEPHVLVSVEEAGGHGELRWVLRDALPLQLLRQRLHEMVELSQDDVATLRALTDWQASLLGSAAQDMRTPLQVIAASVDSLLETEGSLDDPGVRAMLERTSAQVGKLQRLLPTLLQLGRVQLRERTAAREVVDVRQVVDEVLHELEPIGRRVTHDFDVGELETDRRQLARVVLELVNYAADHGPADRPLTIGTEQQGVDVELFLDSPGHELDEGVRGLLFSPLGTGHGPDGNDLGLSLVGIFARMHGGRAWVQDRPDDGVSFRVLLSNALPDRRRDSLDDVRAT